MAGGRKRDVYLLSEERTFGKMWGMLRCAAAVVTWSIGTRRGQTGDGDTGVDPMKRFDVDDGTESAGVGETRSVGECGDTPARWPATDDTSGGRAPVEWPFPPIPPKIQHAMTGVVRDAISAGMSLADTYAGISGILLRHGVDISDDDLSGWLGSNALAET